MYYVYILLCEDKTLYTGITTDPVRRLKEHRSGKGAKYTRVHGALEMVYVEEAEGRAEASKREKPRRNAASERRRKRRG